MVQGGYEGVGLRDGAGGFCNLGLPRPLPMGSGLIDGGGEGPDLMKEHSECPPALSEEEAALSISTQWQWKEQTTLYTNIAAVVL